MIAITRIVLVALVAAALTGCSQSPEQTIIGTWQLAKGEKGKVSELTLEFTEKKGVKFTGKDFADFSLDGTYAIEGEMLVIKLKSAEPIPATRDQIKKLTADELVLADEQGEVEEYRRQK